MSILPAVDAQGYLIPWIGDDDVTEAVEALYDPNAGPAETWGPEWDLDVWQLGSDQLPGEEVPLDDQADEFEPSEEDWRDYHSYCRSVEQRLLEARMASDWDDEQERRYRYTDSDAASAGVAVG